MILILLTYLLPFLYHLFVLAYGTWLSLIGILTAKCWTLNPQSCTLSYSFSSLFLPHFYSLGEGARKRAEGQCISQLESQLLPITECEVRLGYATLRYATLRYPIINSLLWAKNQLELQMVHLGISYSNNPT